MLSATIFPGFAICLMDLPLEGCGLAPSEVFAYLRDERGRDVATSQPVRVTVKGKNIEVTPALRDYAEKRVAKLNKFFTWRGDIVVEVALSVERDTHVAEITYSMGGLLMRGESRTKDLYASIDQASDKIERQVRRYKNKLRRWEHQSPRKGDGSAPDAGAPAPDEPVEAEEADAADAPRVVRTKRFAIKPMDVEEAIMQMELLGHDFFVFANASTDEVNVLYRRKDGQYGLIEPTLEE